MEPRPSARKKRQRELLILALLQQPSLPKAAASIGMSPTTAWRVSKSTEFGDEYRAARSDAYHQAIARLQHATGAAASAILSVLTRRDANASHLLRAADSVLHHSEKAIEFEELEARIARLERAAQERSR